MDSQKQADVFIDKQEAFDSYSDEPAFHVPGSSPEVPFPRPSPNTGVRLWQGNNDRSQTSNQHMSKKLLPTTIEKTTPPKCLNLHHAPPNVQGITLLPTRNLPDNIRGIFDYPLLNAVQSKCFPVVFESDDNFVLSSPTGSGKTAVLELAICRLLLSTNSDFKIVYQAPIKALCSERLRDWQKKFATLGLKCLELTGDTQEGVLQGIQHASIIITTPEKWDNITRRWRDHEKLMRLVRLFLIDEVHTLRDSRGATLEAVVSRMKSVGPNVRFIALSATIPNAGDIGEWLGKSSNEPEIPAPVLAFGEEFRPVKLQRHVYGYDIKGNDFAADKIYDKK